MQRKIWIVPAIGLVATLSAPVVGQEAVEEPRMQNEDPPPPAPPALRIPPPAPPARPLLPRTQRASPVTRISAKPKDYPVEAWRANLEGMVSYTVDVGADGKPSNCEIVDSRGLDVLEEATCKLALEARFNPAKGKDGKPFESTYSDSVFWSKSEPIFPGSMIVHVSALVDPDKDSLDCEILEMSGKFPNSMARQITNSACPLIRAGRGAIYRDEEGNPIKAKVTVRLEVAVEDVPE